MSLRENEKKKFDLAYWDKFAANSHNFMSANHIAIVILIIAVLVQGIGWLITPNEFLIWNALTFIVATNLGAVLLAIQAQRSADNIRLLYESAFDGNFYHTLFLISHLKNVIRDNANLKDKSLREEIDGWGDNLYEVMYAYLEVFKQHKDLEIEKIEDKDIDIEESELFE